MWFSVVLLALVLSQLGGAQECEVVVLSRDQLKREIQTNVATALKHSAITSILGSANETCIVLSPDELNTTLEKVVDAAVEKHLATA